MSESNDNCIEITNHTAKEINAVIKLTPGCIDPSLMVAIGPKSSYVLFTDMVEEVVLSKLLPQRQ